MASPTIIARYLVSYLYPLSCTCVAILSITLSHYTDLLAVFGLLTFKDIYKVLVVYCYQCS